MSKTKNCQLCGADFECNGLLGCWCGPIKVSQDQLAELLKQTSDCVCPNCLVDVQR